MNWIEQLVTAILKWLAGRAEKDRTDEDAAPQTGLRDELRARIDAHERMREQGDLREKR